MTDYNVNIGYKVDTSGLNKANTSLKDINNSLDKSTAKADSFGASLKAAFKDGLNEGLSSVPGLEAGLNKAALAAAGVAAAFAAIAAGATLLFKGLNAAQELNDLALKLGTSADGMDRLRAATIAADADFKGIVSSLETFSTKLEDASRGKKKAVEEFDALGLSAAKLKDLDPNEALFITAKTISQIENFAERQKAANTLLGSGAAEALKLADSYNTINDAVAAGSGNLFGADVLKAASQFDDQMKNIKQNIDFLFVSFINAFGPAVVGAIESVVTALSNVVNQMSQIAKSANQGNWIDTLFGQKGKRGIQIGGFSLGMGDFGNVTGGATTQYTRPNVAGTNPTGGGEGGGGASTAATNARKEAERELAKAIRESNQASKEYFSERMKDESEAIANRQKFDKATEYFTNLEVAAADKLAVLQATRAEIDAGRLTTSAAIDKYLNMELDGLAKAVELEQLKLQAKEAGVEFNAQAYLDTLKTNKAIEDTLEKSKQAADKMNEGIKNISNQFADFLTDALTDSSASFGDFLADLGKQLLNSGLKELFASLFQTNNSGGGGNGYGAIISGIVSMFGGGASTGAAFNNGTQFFANGGIVNRTTPFGMAGGKTGVMGEAGPEAILPLSRMSNGKLGVASGGSGGGKNISFVNNITINNSEDADATAKQTGETLKKMIDQQVRSIINDEQRSGNSLNPTIQYQ